MASSIDLDSVRDSSGRPGLAESARRAFLTGATPTIPGQDTLETATDLAAERARVAAYDPDHAGTPEGVEQRREDGERSDDEDSDRGDLTPQGLEARERER